MSGMPGTSSMTAECKNDPPGHREHDCKRRTESRSHLVLPWLAVMDVRRILWGLIVCDGDP
eukprot:scaffold140944_cov33-Tisochrysis_lutea.AAC.1